MKKLRLAAFGLLGVLSLVAFSGCAATGGATVDPQVVDARADEQLKRMTTALAGMSRFRFDADIRYDDYLVESQKAQFGKRVSVAVARPNRARADVEGDVENKRYWYDGSRAVILDVDRNYYSETPAPDTIDATLTAMAEKHGLVLPLAELIAADSYTWLMNGVQSAAYVGEHRVDGAACHHLAFSQDSLDWQIWIDAGEPPLPRRLLISYKELPNCPQYEVSFVKWTPNAALSPADFTFQLPEGATKIDLTPPASVVGTGTAPITDK